MKTGTKGIELIKQFEGCSLKAYADPKTKAEPYTIGYGNTYYKDGSKIKLGDKITQQQAEDLLLDLLPKYEAIVNKNVTIDLTQNQFDSLVCFAWNCGKSETLFKLVNTKAHDELKTWWVTHYINKGTPVEKGLTRRRTAERDLYFSI